MINLRITGLYNRGQQDEYVELEAAARCDLEGLMLVRYLYNAEGFPIYSQTRLYEFPDTKVTGVPEDEKIFFENGDFEGLLKHMQEKGEIGTAKPSKKAKKSKKSK